MDRGKIKTLALPLGKGQGKKRFCDFFAWRGAMIFVCWEVAWFFSVTHSLRLHDFFFFWRLRDFFFAARLCEFFVERLHDFCVKRLLDFLCEEAHDFCVKRIFLNKKISFLWKQFFCEKVFWWKEFICEQKILIKKMFGIFFCEIFMVKFFLVQQVFLWKKFFWLLLSLPSLLIVYNTRTIKF